MYLYARQDRINVWLFRRYNTGTAKHFELAIFVGMSTAMILAGIR
jgi:hypothetical protein